MPACVTKDMIHTVKIRVKKNAETMMIVIASVINAETVTRMIVFAHNVI